MSKRSCFFSDPENICFVLVEWDIEVAYFKAIAPVNCFLKHHQEANSSGVSWLCVVPSSTITTARKDHQKVTTVLLIAWHDWHDLAWYHAKWVY